MSCFNHVYSVTGNEEAEYYFIYGATVTEVELDVLTGQILIPRVDILYDCGNRYAGTSYVASDAMLRTALYTSTQHESQD